jgi:hypothetical protein
MQPANKVNWLRHVQFGTGLQMSVSDNSGIVKLDIPETGRRAPVLYRDEILFLLENAQEIKQFLTENEDVCFSKEQSKESRGIKREQQKAAVTAAKGLQALGFDNATIAQILAARSKSA